MSETEPTQLDDEEENDEDEGDDSYANAYLDDDVQESDDPELAEMFAKVQSIQQIEGRLQSSVGQQSASGATREALGVNVVQAEAAAAKAPGKSTPTRNSLASVKSRSLSRSPSATTTNGSAGGHRSKDGITTIPRSALSAKLSSSEALLGIKKPVIYEDRLLQAKRIETLSAPVKKSAARQFATDDEERHCRFQPRKSAAQRASAKNSGYDFDSPDAGANGNDFITRMEAAERNRQKVSEAEAAGRFFLPPRKRLRRPSGEWPSVYSPIVENGGQTFLFLNMPQDKKSCPKCGVPQSYSEYRDKKKKCQTCGSEFRFLQAWGDIEHNFALRMADASRAQAEKKEQIFAQVTAQETNRQRVAKTTKQAFYEKQIMQKNSRRTFLERNYKSSSDPKAKRAQLEMEAKRKAAVSRDA
ncbi:hypothetical protein BBJ28_00009121 [Nothophytophthora sp. Chile5]|nr:hypothetical protein BBJ28_00009121 [Nothophytophthora sp. Chile5]